jgi:hypothetical protein
MTIEPENSKYVNSITRIIRSNIIDLFDFKLILYLFKFDIIYSDVTSSSPHVQSYFNLRCRALTHISHTVSDLNQDTAGQ